MQFQPAASPSLSRIQSRILSSLRLQLPALPLRFPAVARASVQNSDTPNSEAPKAKTWIILSMPSLPWSASGRSGRAASLAQAQGLSQCTPSDQQQFHRRGPGRPASRRASPQCQITPQTQTGLSESERPRARAVRSDADLSIRRPPPQRVTPNSTVQSERPQQGAPNAETL